MGHFCRTRESPVRLADRANEENFVSRDLNPFCHEAPALSVTQALLRARGRD
jgi:hypothetical protein